EPRRRTSSSTARVPPLATVCCPRAGRWSRASGKSASGRCEMSGLLTTPPEALGPPRRESVIVEGRTFLIERPTDTDATLEPVGGAAGRCLPYSGDPVPAARAPARRIL